tara:strand:+ start:944 stop:1162 length:219 start_codon:yes stop_codon:yes gene_type:complete
MNKLSIRTVVLCTTYIWTNTYALLKIPYKSTNKVFSKQKNDNTDCKNSTKNDWLEKEYEKYRDTLEKVLKNE